MTGPLGPLVATDVCYQRGGRTLLDHVSLLAPPGQVIGVMGPSGSGKSSLLAVLGGLDRPDAGDVRRDPPDARLGFCTAMPTRFARIRSSAVCDMALSSLSPM